MKRRVQLQRRHQMPQTLSDGFNEKKSATVSKPHVSRLPSPGSMKRRVQQLTFM